MEVDTSTTDLFGSLGGHGNVWSCYESAPYSSHEHWLILNETYIAREGDVCRGCGEQIVSCKSFVYRCSRITGNTSTITSGVDNVSCANFLLHKSCAVLPAHYSVTKEFLQFRYKRITRTLFQNPTHPKEFLQPRYNYSEHEVYFRTHFYDPVGCCNICGIPIPCKVKRFFYCSFDIYACLKCAMLQIQQSLEDPNFEHPAHSQHPLALIQHPSSFKCYACNVDDNIRDMSYRCTKCQFWMHKSCADAPTSFQFQFHDKHPLTLSFSLPQAYHKFEQHCKLCDETLSRSDWLYYCPNCRFFVHFQCARSSRMLRSSCEDEEYDSDLVHLPAADESSLNLLGEQFVKVTSILINNNNNNINIFSSTNGIKHWAHDEHHLQLITSEKLNNKNDDDKILLLCDGCVRPIRTADQFYGCVPCKYFLHKFCAELPKKIEHHLWPGTTIFANKYIEQYKFFPCYGCGVLSNGIFFSPAYSNFKLYIGCATLPKMIKPEAHRHKLNQVCIQTYSRYCNACGERIKFTCNYRCEQCDFYICDRCIMKARILKHPWDPHPLRLINEPGMVMVMDHEHEFNCEFCSEDTNTNFWFYHCSDCDISFHLHECFEQSSFRKYSNVKFGATDIVIDKLHPHSLTFVLNKKVRSCKRCGRQQLGEPVLECAEPCKSIFCRICLQNS